jgi:hypothetical protein
MLRNQKNNKFIGLEINKLKEFFKKGNIHLDRSDKDISSIKNLLASNIYKSKLCLFEKNKFDNTINYKPQNKGHLNNNDEKIELNKNEVENNIWVQATKETFDDLLLGNEALDNDEDFYYKDEDYVDKSVKNDPNIDDLEKYFINTGYFIKKSTEKKRIKKDSMDRRNQRFTVTKYMKSSTKTYSNYATVNIVNEGEELEIPEEKPAKDINNLPITDRYHLDDKDDLVEMAKKTRTPKIQTKSSSRKLKAIEENNEKINYLYLNELNQETL